tara:strand:- start:9376 stop:9618 length:243 start_codon:yes stop_codon:yes gene_type:complete
MKENPKTTRSALIPNGPRRFTPLLVVCLLIVIPIVLVGVLVTDREIVPSLLFALTILGWLIIWAISSHWWDNAHGKNSND